MSPKKVIMLTNKNKKLNQITQQKQNRLRNLNYKMPWPQEFVPRFSYSSLVFYSTVQFSSVQVQFKFPCLHPKFLQVHLTRLYRGLCMWWGQRGKWCVRGVWGAKSLVWLQGASYPAQQEWDEQGREIGGFSSKVRVARHHNHHHHHHHHHWHLAYI